MAIAGALTWADQFIPSEQKAAPEGPECEQKDIIEILLLNVNV